MRTKRGAPLALPHLYPRGPLGLTCAGANTMLGHCNELLCPGVLAAILLPSTLLLILATLSACCFRGKYTPTQETAGTGADSSSGKAVHDN